MQLYKIAEDYKAVEEMDGDVTDTLDMIEGEFNDKANNILALVKNWDGNIAALDAEIKRLQDMKAGYKSNQERLKEYLRHNMQETGISKIECPLFKVTLSQPSKQCEVFDGDLLPDDCVTVKTTIAPDKTQILKRLKEGEEIPGAKLIEGKPRLTIR